MGILPIAVLGGVAATAFAGGAMLLQRRKREERLLRGRALGQATEADAPDDDGIVETVGRIGHVVSAGKSSRELKQKLAMAGYHGSSATTVFMGAKMLMFAVGITAFSLVFANVELGLIVKLFLILTSGAVMSFVPNIVVEAKRGKRCEEIRTNLPDAIDLLEICVSSGMGLDMAWNAVADEFRSVSPTFADEMELTNLEIGLGVARADAMRHMAERTGADDLTSLVALLVQSERFGAGVVDALRMFAKTMRDTRTQRAEEAAEKTTVKLLFPMVMFIFPALMMVMVGPALLMLAEVMDW